ncbi:hypothetical protein A3A59_03000 [Candidatus Gottesmanbacteria bacterium RIFCSPLOWO2_01_FULL_42_10]|nr:MAG: hypothetical protein A3A59_03000 [Candidatus Gottesmanbacteria bacterium RIFCSPLOWO2_01_FULL_42_10]
MKHLLSLVNSNKTIKWLLVVVALKQLLWIAFIPMWQFPDEQAHFGQVQNFAEGNPYGPTDGINTSLEIIASEQLLGTKRDEMGNNKYTYHPEYNLSYAQTKSGIYEPEISKFPFSFRHTLVASEATVYPQLYYSLGSFFYKLVYGQDLFWRIFMVRLVNIALFLSLVYVAYKIGDLLFPEQLLTQVTFTIMVAFQPMLSFVAGGINSDNLFNLLFTLAIYSNLRILKSGWKIREIILCLVLISLSIWTKPQGKLAVLLYIFPLGLTLVKQKKSLLPILGALLVLVWFFRDNVSRLLASQQFLPDIPAWSRIKNMTFTSYLNYHVYFAKLAYRETIPWYWGVFRWLSLTYPRVVHRVINWLLVFAVGGCFLFAIKNLRQLKNAAVINFSFLLYASFMYVAALVTFDYLFFTSHGYSLGLQGRYFLPTVAAHMGIILIGLRALIFKTQFVPYGLKLLGGLIVLFHTYAFLFVSNSYFSPSNLKTVFIYASQYKPLIFKSPFLEIYLLVTGFSLIKFLSTFFKLRNYAETN